MAIFKNETWSLTKDPEVSYIVPFCPRGLKLSLFLLYRQRFPRYGPIIKITIFGNETWPLAKVLEVTHVHSFNPRGAKLS